MPRARSRLASVGGRAAQVSHTAICPSWWLLANMPKTFLRTKKVGSPCESLSIVSGMAAQIRRTRSICVLFIGCPPDQVQAARPRLSFIEEVGKTRVLDPQPHQVVIARPKVSASAVAVVRFNVSFTPIRNLPSVDGGGSMTPIAESLFWKTVASVPLMRR